MTIKLCGIKELTKIQDSRGNLTFIESRKHIGFDIKRVYYLYDVPAGSERGSHAHRDLHQFIIAASGSFDVILDDGKETCRYHLNRPYIGLYICPLIWRTLENFSSGAVCLVLASQHFDEDDYFRNYNEFLRIRSGL